MDNNQVAMSTSAQPGKAVFIGGDRRSHRRYGIELDLSYVAHTGNRITMAGSGKSCNVSSSGLMFRTNGSVEEGGTLVAAMRWPLPAAESGPLLLVVSGRVVWSASDLTALAITRHEFIPESQYRPNDLRSLLPLRMIPARSGARRATAKSKPGRPMILVVDHEDRQGILAKLLESYGYSVQYAERNRAVELLDARHCDIQVLITGSMRGFERFAESVPVILTPGEGAPDAAEAALARRIVRRPFVLREILSAVHDLGSPRNSFAASGPPRPA